MGDEKIRMVADLKITIHNIQIRVKPPRRGQTNHKSK